MTLKIYVWEKEDRKKSTPNLIFCKAQKKCFILICRFSDNDIHSVVVI